MSEGATIFLFLVLPLVVLCFLPTFLALCWRRNRLFSTFAVNLSVLIIGPVGTLLAIATLVVPKEVLDRVLDMIHVRKTANQPRAWRERTCPSCRQWMTRTSSACPRCHALVEPLDQECPACKQAMPLTATTCLACGYDQRAEQESRSPGPI